MARVLVFLSGLPNPTTIYILQLALRLARGNPAFQVSLTAARDGKRSGRDILRDGGAGGDIRALFNANRRNKVDVAADECVILNGGAMFALSVIVGKHHAAAKIDALTQVCVSYIRQM